MLVKMTPQKTTALAAGLLLIVLSACTNAMVGEPPLVPASSPDALPRCKTVAANAPNPGFTTQYYMTTWGSAVAEGAAMGVREGLSEGGGVGWVALARIRPVQSVGGVQLLWRGANQTPFCMVINASEARVAQALRGTFQDMRGLGYTSRVSGPLNITSFAKREHSAAKWVDRFAAFTYPLEGGRTAVVVRRDVLISRRGSPYIEGNSVGELETWVLTTTRKKATGK